MKLLKKTGLPYLLLSCLFAMEVNAAGSITPHHERDFSGDYSSKGLDVSLWGNTAWSVGASYNKASHQQTSFHTTVGYQFPDGTVVLGDYYKYRDPDIFFNMGSLTLSFPLGFISSKLSNTSVSLSNGKTTYESDTAIKRKLHRDDYSLGLVQSISSNWQLGSSYSWHHYTEYLGKIEAQLINQKIRNASIVRALLGLYVHQWDLWTDFNFSSRSRFSFHLMNGKKLFFGRTRTHAVEYGYNLTESTEIGLQLTRISDESEVSRYLALSFSYYF